MLVRRERPDEAAAVRAVHGEAFDSPDGTGSEPVEARLVDSLRTCSGWIPALSLVAAPNGEVVGHVVCTRATLDDGTTRMPVLGLGPIGVRRAWQGRGVGQALMHAVLGAADALGEPLVVLLGAPAYYARFGFEPASRHGIRPPVAAWEPAFQVRRLSAWTPSWRGAFRYAEPFERL